MQSPQNGPMTTSITIRNVPTDVRDELASRAALAGRSLQEHLLMELIQLARRPSMEALMERVRSRQEASGVRVPPARILAYRNQDRK